MFMKHLRYLQSKVCYPLAHNQPSQTRMLLSLPHLIPRTKFFNSKTSWNTAVKYVLALYIFGAIWLWDVRDSLII